MDGTLVYKIDIDSKNAEKNVSSLGSKMDNFASKVGGVGKKLTLGATLPIVGLGAAAAKSAMELEATGAKYETVFAGMTDEADGFIKEFQKLTPATTAGAKSMASSIQDLLVPMGFAREEATKMTGDTMHLVGALTNFNSATHSAEQVSTAFQSALTGEMQSLKGLGIQIDAATLEQKALEMTGKKTTAEITKQDKAAALMALAYAQSTDALAAYNEESLDTTTKMGLANASFQDSLAVLGEQLLPIITMAIEKFAQFAEWIGGLDEKTLGYILTIGTIIAVIGPLLLIFSKLILIIKGVGIALTFLAMNPIILVIGAIVIAIILLVKHFKTVKKVALLVAKAIGNAFISMVNIVISAINNMIKIALLPMNAIIKTMNLIPGVNIPTLKVAIPKLPKLSVGTDMVKSEGMAHLHPGEAVVPADVVSGGFQGTGFGNNNMSITIEQPDINMDGRTVARQITPYITKTIKLSGGNI